MGTHTYFAFATDAGLNHHRLVFFIAPMIGGLTAVAMSLFAAYHAWKHPPQARKSRRAQRS